MNKSEVSTNPGICLEKNIKNPLLVFTKFASNAEFLHFWTNSHLQHLLCRSIRTTEA